jgi:hypothetical protein
VACITGAATEHATTEKPGCLRSGTATTTEHRVQWNDQQAEWRCYQIVDEPKLDWNDSEEDEAVWAMLWNSNLYSSEVEDIKDIMREEQRDDAREISTTSSLEGNLPPVLSEGEKRTDMATRRHQEPTREPQLVLIPPRTDSTKTRASTRTSQILHTLCWCAAGTLRSRP